MIVSAEYNGELDQAREQRIHDVFKRCGVRWGAHEPLTPEQQAQGYFPIVFSDVDWISNTDNNWTGLKIHVDNAERERAQRIASELRGCGMVVGIGADDDVDWPEGD